MRYAVVASCEDFYQYVVTIDGLRWLARRIRKQNSPMNSPKCQRLGKSLSNWKNLLCIAYRFREKFFKNHQGKVIYDFVKHSPLHTEYLVCSKQSNQVFEPGPYSQQIIVCKPSCLYTIHSHRLYNIYKVSSEDCVVFSRLDFGAGQAGMCPGPQQIIDLGQTTVFMNFFLSLWELLEIGPVCKWNLWWVEIVLNLCKSYPFFA